MTTNFDICQAALRKIGVVAIGQTASAEELETAYLALGRMMAAWQNRGYNLWAVASGSVTLTTALSYAITPRAFDIQSVRFKRGTTEMAMRRMTRDEYDEMPVKTTTGTPTSWYYDRQALTGTLYIWPALATAAGETLVTTSVRAYVHGEVSDEADIPAEWMDAVVYGLAARLADDFEMASKAVIARAEDELRMALSYDREGSVYFVGDSY